MDPWIEREAPATDHLNNRRIAKEDGEDDALHKLRLIAEAAESDIVADHPDVERGYNLYAESIVVGAQRWPYARRKLVGVIDMGDLYQAVFEYDKELGEWQEIVGVSSYDVIDLITEQRVKDAGR